jgi:serine/threonine protein kinase
MSDLLLIKKKYKILEKIGEGKFGVVYKGKNIRSEEPVAIKLEHKSNAVKILRTETTILNYLYKNGCKFIPLVHWFGIFLESPTLVMTYYEQSLETYIEKNDNISLEQKEKIFQVILNIIESIHEQYVIHRDIKPQNFMMKGTELFLIDFGMATMYVDSDKIHIPEKKDKSDLIGTPRFMSINIHNGWEPSRRDDVISACYIYMYMIFESLPWDNTSERQELKKKDYLIVLVKDYVTFSSFLKYSYNIEFKEKPIYTSEFVADKFI